MKLQACLAEVMHKYTAMLIFAQIAMTMTKPFLIFGWRDPEDEGQLGDSPQEICELPSVPPATCGVSLPSDVFTCATQLAYKAAELLQGVRLFFS